MGRMPDPPVNGYVSSGADLGDLCCPCWMGTKRADDVDPTEVPAEKDAEEEAIE